MKKPVTIFFMAGILHISYAFFNPYKNSFIYTTTSDLDSPLILTPYLKDGRIEEARTDAEIHLADFQNVTSYSGFFTVDEENNGNLFIWFCPSEGNYTQDPVILWLNGGPGTSSLLGLFGENGPFDTITYEGGFDVVLRNHSWTRNHSVLYIDQPVGTGFSFTEGEFLQTEDEVAEHLYSALIQFFTMFPELQENSFILAGESYGGIYIPVISHYIHEKNQNCEAPILINMEGILIGNGYTDPINQNNYGDLLYQLGLYDLNALNLSHQAEETFIQLVNEGKYEEATNASNSILDIFNQRASVNVYNYLQDRDSTPTVWTSLFGFDDVREAIHVGNLTYQISNDDVYNAMLADQSISRAYLVADLLSYYRVLIYNGQVDIICAYSLTENYLQKLNFSSADEYLKVERNIWHVDDRIAGYVKEAGNLTEVLVRNAGHFVPTDQPEFAYNLIYNFIRNISLVTN